MASTSAALLVYRIGEANEIEVLVAHMGGPFWARKDARAWSVPKGEYDSREDSRAAARREFEEEIGSPPPAGDMIDLGSFKQSSGKVIVTYAVRGDLDLAGFHSNTFTMEWPKGTGTMREFPEMDRAEWMTLTRAAQMLVKGQVPILQALSDRLAAEQAE